MTELEPFPSRGGLPAFKWRSQHPLGSQAPPLLHRRELVHLAQLCAQLLPQGEGQPIPKPYLLL
jgi:hypothetical protein